MEYKRAELEALLETVQQKLMEQGMVVDARLIEKAQMLKRVIKTLEQDNENDH